MSVDITRGYDSFFGPPSEPISVRKFLDDTASLVLPSASDVLDHAGWQSLSEDERAAVAGECSGGCVQRNFHCLFHPNSMLNVHDSVAELKAAVEDVWNNPMLSAHLYRTHAAAVNAVHSSQAGGPASKGRKRKHLPDPETAEAQPEVHVLEERLEAISLRCWGYDSCDMRSTAELTQLAGQTEPRIRVFHARIQALGL